MGIKTGISYVEHTFNPWWGCAEKPGRPGCERCYARRAAKRTGQDNLWGERAPRKIVGDSTWRQPLAWNRATEGKKLRPRVLCGTMCDVFEDREDLDSPRQRLFKLIEETSALDWLLLTKRPENILRQLPESWTDVHIPANVWLGCTIENQRSASLDFPKLISMPARRVFVSIEPVLGPIRRVESGLFFVDWVIVGCESGPARRSCELSWVRQIVEAARANATPIWVKQLPVKGRVSTDPREWPEDLRVQEVPPG